MEPRIQFCTSADGTRVGYGTRGERDGTPLVYVKAFFMSEKAIWNGWPWNTTICIQFTDHAADPSGNIVYENRGVIMGKIE